MKNTNFKIIAVLFFVIISYSVNAQGCSDAGFCTLNSFKPSDPEEMPAKNQFKVGISFGGADHNISIFANYLEYNRQFNDKLSLDAKITSMYQRGETIGNLGLSDIFLNLNYKLEDKLRVTLGTKIPLSDGNKIEYGVPSPLDYQASLGTFDLILGVGYEVKNIQFVAALQQPLTQNKNTFLSSKNQRIEFNGFQSTNMFKRSGDVLLRVSYPFVLLDKKLTLNPSILPIYHLGNDKYTDAKGIQKEITGSQGLTLNGNLYADYALNEKHALQLSLSMPFIIRDARPDGLTRSFVVALEYRVKF